MVNFKRSSVRLNRPVTSLRHQGGKSFVRGGYIFKNMSNTFSRGAKKF